MSQPYVGEIRMFAGTFAPQGWANCDGQEMPISDNEVLFQLVGTTYGGDGQETFGLPDLRGRAPVHQGQGSSSSYVIGQNGGAETSTVTQGQTPVHNHPFLASTAGGTSDGPAGKVIGSPPAVTLFIRDTPGTPLPASSVTSVGGSQPHENRMPFIAIRYIISLYGVFPSQS